MPRCSHCGKVNRDGSLFCQDCGHRLEASPPKREAAGVVSAGGGDATCSACGTVNPPGMNFCKMCGTALTRPAAPAAQSPAAGKATCAACGKQTPAGFSFCQHCGHRLGAAPPPTVAPAPVAPPPAVVAPPAAPTAPPPGVAMGGGLGTASTVAAAPAPVTPTPPAGLPRIAPTAARPVARPAEDALAQTVAPSPEELAYIRGAAAPAPAVARAPQPLHKDTMPDGGMRGSPGAAGRLISVRRDGSDGPATPLVGETFDIGKSEGGLQFQDDPYLAPRHARLVIKDGKVFLRVLDALNGVYVRVQGASEIQPGDQFLVGKEVLRFETVSPEEREPRALVEHGVRFFGSVPREAWGRLRQLTISGTTRDVWHLSRPELVLGREEGDVTFPDDEFMSRRHAALRRVGQKIRLEDLNSSNGTFLRVRTERELQSGDVLRLGDQLMRFET